MPKTIAPTKTDMHIDSEIRSRCHGVTKLDARLESWMVELCQQSDVLDEWVENYGSPLNVVNTDPFARNINALIEVAEQRNLSLEVYFARKANKCLAFVETAARNGWGVDTASENELRQAIATGCSPEKLLSTAAVKSESLVEVCVREQVTVVVDNQDELDRVIKIAKHNDQPVTIALRVGGFQFEDQKLHSRFGFDVSEVESVANSIASDAEIKPWIRLKGLHFHLDGYCPAQRMSAIRQSLKLIDIFSESGHLIEFLDIGGGFPVCYLKEESQWEQFWNQHKAALLGQRDPLTYRNHSLGLHVHDGQVVGDPNSYPFYQSPNAFEWLELILDAEFEVADTDSPQTIAEAIVTRKLQLRCEPGRSVLNGCGMTIARVESVKKHVDGDLLIALSMNRSQCRTSSDDFLVDPILIPTSQCRESDDAKQSDGNKGIREKQAGFLTGMYCTESELILLRKLCFPEGIYAGDLIVIPNTAGYLMHFLESRSHQFPLATNIVMSSADVKNIAVDNIDRN